MADSIYGGLWKVRRFRKGPTLRLRVWLARKFLWRTGFQVAVFSGPVNPTDVNRIYGRGLPADQKYRWAGWIYPNLDDGEPPLGTERSPLDW